MHDLLTVKKISEFTTILAALRARGVGLRDMIDGGAGFGETALQMFPYATGIIHAFEPFPGNHRFFDGLDPRIRLIKKALYHKTSTVYFNVLGTVPADSEWGRRGFEGYSSAGKIVDSPCDKDVPVEAVRADSLIKHADFVKLDLEGGELNAIKGLGRLRDSVKFMWVEYTGQHNLLPVIRRFGYTPFDTAYLFRGEPTAAAEKLFTVLKTGTLSSGASVWYGFRRFNWKDFATEFPQLQRSLKMIQTDLACVNKSFYNTFITSIYCL